MSKKRKVVDLTSPKDPTVQVINVSKLKKGDIVSTVEYFLVEKVDSEYVWVQTLNGRKRIARSLLEYASYKTSDQNTTTQKLCKTALVLKLRDAVKSHSVKVDFIKKNGETRTMMCRITNFCGVLGYSTVMELLEKDGNFVEQQRQINHQTLTRVVFDGIEYKLK